MTTLGTRVRLLDPTSAPLPATGEMAPRPADLTGLRLGFLANGKRNSGPLMEAIYSLLAERFQIADAVFRTKKDPSRPAPKEMVEELLAQCDAIVTGPGD